MTDKSHTVLAGYEFDSVMLADPITGEAYSTIRDYPIEVGFQALVNHQRITALGYAPGVNKGTPADSWGGAGLYPWLNVATQLELVAGAAADGVAGAGAQSVQVNGLDGNFNEVVQTALLNGTSPVVLPTPLYRVNLMRVVAHGASGTNVSQINLRDHVGGTVRALIAPGAGITRQSVYTVPAGWTLQVFSQVFSINRSQTTVTFPPPAPNQWQPIYATAAVFTRSNGGPALLPLDLGVSDVLPYRHDGSPGITITEKTDFCHRILSVTASNVDITAGWLGIRRLNPPLNKLT